MKLYGKDTLITYFQTALQKQAVSHLYVFEGAVGMGKKTFCSYLSSLLLCEGAQKPCGKCSACIKTKSRNHPDVIYVENDVKSPMKAEQARALVMDMHVKPFLAERKIYIIPNGEALSPAVQNTLLKIFEEPPSYITILLTVTSADALLKTVLSRAIVMQMPGCSMRELETYICESFPDMTNVAALLAAQANGSPGQAAALAADETYLSMRAALYGALPLLTGARADIYKILDCFETHKAEMPALLALFLSFLRDALLIKTAQSVPLINRDFADSMNAFSEIVSEKGLIQCFGAVMYVASHFTKGANFTLWITDLLLACWRFCHDTDSGYTI